MLEPNFEEADGLGNSLVVCNVKFLIINLFSGTMIRLIKWPFAMPFICQFVVFCIGVLSVVKKQSFAVGHGPRKSSKQKKRQDSQESESVDEEFESWFEDINQSDKKIPKSQKSRASKKRLRPKHQQQSPQKKRHNSRQSPLKKRHDSQKSTKSDSDGLFEGRFEARRRKKIDSHSPQKKRHNSRQSPSKKRHNSQKSTKSDSDGKFEGRFERKAPEKKKPVSKQSTQSDDSSNSGDNRIDPGLQKKRNPSQKSTQSDLSGRSDNFGFTLNESAVGFSSQSSVDGSQDTNDSNDSNHPSLYSTQPSSDSGEEPDYEFFVTPKMYASGKKKGEYHTVISLIIGAYEFSKGTSRDGVTYFNCNGCKYLKDYVCAKAHEDENGEWILDSWPDSHSCFPAPNKTLKKKFSQALYKAIRKDPEACIPKLYDDMEKKFTKNMNEEEEMDFFRVRSEFRSIQSGLYEYKHSFIPDNPQSMVSFPLNDHMYFQKIA